MFDRSQDSEAAKAVVEVVHRSLTQEERAFGTLPNGELHERYALEAFMDLVALSAGSVDENCGSNADLV
jgi:hypothetical protein